MSRLLVELLGVKERGLRDYVARLEHVCLNPSVDIRLSAEVTAKTRHKLSGMPGFIDNSPPQDVYLSLQELLISHDRQLQAKLRIKNDTDKDTVAKRLAIAISKLSKNERAVCMSAAATKRVLKAAPPTKTLRLLKLRSLESVVKRFDPRMLYAVACLVESKSWRSQTHAKMKRLSDRDIVWQPVTTIAVPSVWYEKLSEVFGGKGFYHVNRETGTLLVMPVVAQNRPGSTVLSMSLLLQSAHRLAMDSLPYKRRSFLRGHHTVLQEIAHGLQPQLAKIHGLTPNWPVVYQLFGDDSRREDQYDTQLLLGDIDWQSVELKLSKLVPDMEFWQDSHYLAQVTDKGPVSLHVVDVATSLVAGRKLGDQPTAHMESSLWNELQLRYLREEVMTKALMKQLMSDEELVVY